MTENPAAENKGSKEIALSQSRPGAFQKTPFE